MIIKKRIIKRVTRGERGRLDEEMQSLREELAGLDKDSERASEIRGRIREIEERFDPHLKDMREAQRPADPEPKPEPRRIQVRKTR